MWKLVEEWEMREPGEHRDPAPPIAAKAAIAVAAAWGWHRVAALMWVMFHGLLRPGESGELKVGDFKFFPGDTPEEVGNYVLIIREPKTARRYAKKQHVVLDEPALVSYLKWCLAGRGEDEYFYGMSNSTFVDRVSRILKKLGLDDLFTPAGLRTGGATHEWVRRRNFDQLRLRGRWMNAKTLESYIQESITQIALGNLAERDKKRLEALGTEGFHLISNLGAE